MAYSGNPLARIHFFWDGTSDAGGGAGTVYVGNRHSVGGTPVNGGKFFAEAGALKWMGSSGTVTTIAPA